MRSRFLVLVALTLALVAVMGGVAYGQTYTTPEECYACHGVTGTGAVGKVDFDVPDVDYAKCATCHGSLVGASFGTQHWHTVNRCADCHAVDQPPAITDYSRWFLGMYTSPTSGVFRTSASLLSSPQTLHEAHSRSGWVNSLTFARSANCQPCHQPVTCSACHVDAVGHTEHAVSAYPAVSYLQATGTGTTTEPSTCVNSSCHDPAKAATAEFVPWCGSCHPARVEEHGYDTIDHVADDGSVEGIACSACHALDLATAHGDPGAAGASCATCHPMPRDSFAAWDQTCATGGCHTVASTAPMHADITTAHQVDAANQLCLDCHTGTELGSIHTGAETTTGETSCLVCHTASSAPVTRDCTVCHFTFDAHYDEAAHTSATLGCGGDGCHAVASGLMTVHEERNAAFSCWGCHKSVRTAVQDAIDAGNTSCEACHGAISGLGGHRDAHWPVPLLEDAEGPRYSYYTGSVGEYPTGDCMICHTQNLVDEHLGIKDGTTGFYTRFPQIDDAGNPLTCGTCHDQPAGSAVQNAIAAGLSACESCHPVHGPINPVHTSTFVDSPEVPCADCHSANLTVEHNGGYKSTAGLTGCAVCHNLYIGMTSGPVTGVATQAAISTANDTRCSVCHTAYHTDSTAHETSVAESLACGSCHAVGATTIDVTTLHPTCATCHSSTRIGDISGHAAECASCHSTEGTDYHKAMGTSHEYFDMGESCRSCHASTLPEEHEAYLARYPDYATTCALCHKNPTLSLTGKTATCADCHEIHGDIPTLHTATASEACVRCHGSADLRVLHGDTMDASCTTCHNATFDLTGKTAECTTCHYNSEGGVPFHASMDGLHIGLGTTGTCEGAGCHPSRDITMIHERFIGPGKQYSQYEDTCALCHINDDPDRIDWATTTGGTCANCHGVPHDRMNHVATSVQSQDCFGCHDDWVPATHAADPSTGGSWANCDTCHNNPLLGDLTYTKTSSDCEGCHAKTPVATAHYPVTTHLAVHTDVCVDCHYMDLKAEHAKATVTCVECHTDPSDSAIITAGWNKTCSECHLDMHNDKTTRHASTRTDCSTSGCHESDVSAIHGGLPGMGCSSCHTGPAQLDADLTKDCTASGCHGDGYHAGLPALHTATASNDCTRCHPAALPDGSQLEPLHTGVCATCHNTTIDASTKTAECTTCHNTTVSPFHGEMNDTHTFTLMDASCQQAGCHTRTLPEEHAKFLSRYSGYADSCALCHLNADPNRIDWTTATADCSTCHTVHGNIDTLHGTTASQACVDCHEYSDVRDVHGTSREASCAVCHTAPTGRIDWTTTTIECTSCHGTYTQIDPNHYPLAKHDATSQTGCNQCHYKDMKAEHFKPTVAVTCVLCHETKVDSFTAPWDKTCAACHPTSHGDRNAKHVSATASCGGTGCHVIGDVSTLHQALNGNGCYVCHKNPDSPATTTDCTASGCHAGVGTDHKGLHEAAGVNPVGCSGCHFMNLVDEHAALGFTCDTCHKSTVAAVTAAIAANDLRCKSCHPGMHSRQDYEFNPGMGSGHRVNADQPGMRSSFVVNGRTYTWSLPSTSGFLKTGYTTSSMLACSSCHTYAGATGPHGATMTVNMDPAYPADWQTRRLSGSSGFDDYRYSPSAPAYTGGYVGTSSGAVICDKCHNANYVNMNEVHGEGDHEGAYCTDCHTQMPHGWRLPRLLAYTSDPTPYASRRLEGISLASHSPMSGWDESDCFAGCDDHEDQVSSKWPSTEATPVTAGTVAGTVKDSSGAAISGATVSIADKTGTTGSTGTYSVTDVAAGTYTMTVSATGYNAWSGSVSVTAGATATLNVSLVKTPTTPMSTNLARTGSATASNTDGSNYPSRAIDGSTSTYWRANGSGTEWLRVDLGSVKTVSSVVVKWYSSRYARTYRIETSTDGSTWTSQYSTYYGNGGVDTIAIPSVSARYVRVYMTRANDGDYRIGEFEVWGY
ncbi:MAG: discoidin domain-containing protein [Coriobacteriia bacterium]